jgi:hypothetical protein
MPKHTDLSSLAIIIIPSQLSAAVFTLLMLLTTTSNAQPLIPSKAYPKTVFANPMKIPISLAGNFGECRPNHFHSGLDVRTNKVENLPVHAIAAGYVSRVKIEAGGFGNAIYITHAGGYTSLYAHLNDFYPELESYIRSKQYEQKSWKIDINFLPHQFPVNQGKYIAKSGNTGSSQAPHLHMEIRDSKTEKPLNGLLFYNLPDTKAPLLKKLAIYDANKSIYDQSPKQILCTGAGNSYKPGTDTIIVSSNAIALGIVADDPMEGALGVLGVYEADLYVNDQPYFAWQLDNIGYDETRYMNAMADYKTKKNGGTWIQLCYKLPGDKLGIYKNFATANDGRIYFTDTRAKKVKIKIYDVKGNYSTMQCWIKSTLTDRQKRGYEFEAGRKKQFNNGTIAIDFAGSELYDGINVIASTTDHLLPYSYKYNVHRGDVPVHSYFDLMLKPKLPIPETLSAKVALVKLPYGKETGKKGKAAKLTNGWVACSVRDFGVYEICIDQAGPSITGGPASALAGMRINITCKDDMTTVQNFVGTIDGQWVRFQQKGNSFLYELDRHCPVGAHNLTVHATDENGNTSSKTWNFTR